MIFIGMLTAFGNPISAAAGSQGKIRNFQLIAGGINITIVPIAYHIFKICSVPEYVFYCSNNNFNNSGNSKVINN
ncbi:hypothetical protein [Kriegella aquimaris]|uniref:Uncharacterized protein n=1 Tax=Kriegella aquimaris TaxID=192904 RepID=A0A1G9U6J2_9FLAO|nr:hypothetical protein [Kriegella aquimaris]SDM55175.1 hypothetical protein SAMN04488514_110126 [Kriegella aquimaris]